MIFDRNDKKQVVAHGVSAGYQAMIDASAARRVATSDEIADAAAFLLGEHASFINGTDLLIDGGVIASIRTGMFQLQG